MKFKKEYLQDLVYDEVDGVIKDQITDTSRWSTHHEMVFKYEDRYYKTYYSVGSTEQQEESPFEYDDDEIECKEVFPIEKTIIVYE